MRPDHWMASQTSAVGPLLITFTILHYLLALWCSPKHMEYIVFRSSNWGARGPSSWKKGGLMSTGPRVPIRFILESTFFSSFIVKSCPYWLLGIVGPRFLHSSVYVSLFFGAVMLAHCSIVAHKYVCFSSVWSPLPPVAILHTVQVFWSIRRLHYTEGWLGVF